MKISIVVPAFNEEKLIAASLAAIRASMETFAARGWASELIVCDNNSADRTSELAKAAGAIVVFEPINQIARARNKGAEAATGDWLVFVDADSHPSAELFADVAAAIESGKYIYGGCTVKLEGNYRMANRVTALWNSVSRWKKWAAGSFIFCERAAFCEIGGFDNRLFASEEIDLSKRLWRLAKAKGKSAVILRRHPLLTSARKLHLYRTRDMALFLGRALFNRKTVQDRDACYVWYDGKR